jgi:hypothetical protein
LYKKVGQLQLLSKKIISKLKVNVFVRSWGLILKSTFFPDKDGHTTCEIKKVEAIINQKTWPKQAKVKQE